MMVLALVLIIRLVARLVRTLEQVRGAGLANDDLMLLVAKKHMCK